MVGYLINRVRCRIAGHDPVVARVQGPVAMSVWTVCHRCGRLLDWREAPDV